MVSPKAPTNYDKLHSVDQDAIIIHTKPCSYRELLVLKARNELCQEWVSMLAAANIPLSKSDHPAVREFLRKRVVNGGAIPKSKQLQECYLQREVLNRVDEVKEIMKGKPVSILTDEMSDANGRFVLNVLAAQLELKDGVIKTYLIETMFLEATNSSTVAAAVVKAVTNYSIDYDNVIAINTDNASYMREAYSSVWRGLFPESVHITCLAHMANLLGEAFKKPFTDVTKFVKNMNAIFWNAGARKGRYLRYLKETNTAPVMPPNPIGTRWNCWYDTVEYHSKHMDIYKAFVTSEMHHAKALAPNSLKELNDVLQDDWQLRSSKHT